MKCEASQELAVGGFTEPKGKRVGRATYARGWTRSRAVRKVTRKELRGR